MLPPPPLAISIHTSGQGLDPNAILQKLGVNLLKSLLIVLLSLLPSCRQGDQISSTGGPRYPATVHILLPLLKAIYPAPQGTL